MKYLNPSSIILGMMTLGLFACTGHPQPQHRVSAASTSTSDLPPPPRVIKKVASVTEDGMDYTRATTPALRTSLDGRVTFTIKPIDLDNVRKYSFNLIRPEEMGDTHFMQESPGLKLLAEKTRTHLPDTHTILMDSLPDSNHATLCEDPADNNPRHQNNKDIYKIYVLGKSSQGIPDKVKKMKLFSLPVTITVDNPKTSQAYISNVELHRDEMVVTDEILGFDTVFEPMVTADGRLFTGRIEGGNFKDHGFAGGNQIFYTLLEENKSACDVTGWTTFKPIGYAPHDPEMKGKYGIADFEFRDPSGKVLGNPKTSTAGLRGTYPWVDRLGNNLFYHIGGSNFDDTVGKRYGGNTCPDTECKEKIEGGINGLAVMGRWTHGKTVLLDGYLNGTDFGVGTLPSKQAYLSELYDGISVRIAAGRENRAGMPPLPGNIQNTDLVDSFENLFNYHPSLKPMTPRDVVWIVNMGTVSEEVVFDEYLDKNVVIFSDMNIAMQNGKKPSGSYNDVYYKHGTLNNNNQIQWKLPLQNAATSPLYKIPATGFVRGAGRVEPVAMGGLYGKGFWMGGNTEIDYELDASYNQLANQDYYFGIFVDPRHQGKKVLATFPKGGILTLDRAANGSLTLGITSGEEAEEIELPVNANHWFHLGIQVNPEGQRASSVAIFADGNLISNIEEVAGFNLGRGSLMIGQYAEDEDEAIKGWIDEVKLIMIPEGEPLNPEIKCNHARGSIVRLAGGDASSLQSQSVRQALAASRVADAYTCHTDYSEDYIINLSKLGSSMTSVRDQLLFPEGPLEANEPRPDSSNNSFCLSCHFDDEPRLADSLTVKALTLDGSLVMKEDRRRQPMQTITNMYGFFPDNWMDLGDDASVFDDSPIEIDELLTR